jgi:chromate transporter
LAHLGYFERTYVRSKQWLTIDELTRLIALCQILPGPTSSQVGFLIGQRRAGLPGAFAAWVGFTLPSALLMFACAKFLTRLPSMHAQAIVSALKWVTVMVVAQAVWQMARAFCSDWQRVAIAVMAAACWLLARSTATQFAVLALAAAAGAWIINPRALPAAAAIEPHEAQSLRRTGSAAFIVFALLQVALLAGLLSSAHTLAGFAGLLYRTGSVVFGGGHLVLPLLHDMLVPSAWVTNDAFLAGYGAAQALPGPLFTFAAYLGALAAPPGSAALWAVIALVSLFAPGLLLALAATPLWRALEQRAAARAALAGLSAAVVGLLGSALLTPIGTSAIHRPTDLAIIVPGFVALHWRVPPIVVVAATVLLALALARNG